MCVFYAMSFQKLTFPLRPLSSSTTPYPPTKCTNPPGETIKKHLRALNQNPNSFSLFSTIYRFLFVFFFFFGKISKCVGVHFKDVSLAYEYESPVRYILLILSNPFLSL